jgi:hypothetical protein
LLTLGAGVGWQIGMNWVLPTTNVTTLLMAGALPLLIAVVPAVQMAGLPETRKRDDGTPREPLLPEESGGLTGLLLVCTAIWGVVVGASIVAWHRVSVTGFTRDSVSSAGFPVWMLGAMAVGMAIASRRATRQHRSVGSYGVALAGMGAGQTVLVLLGGWYCWHVSVLDAGREPQWWLWQMLVGIACFTAGYALPYGKRALMARSGSEPLTHAQIVSVAGCGLGVGGVASATILIGAIGTMATVAATALTALAAGGTLIVQDRGSVHSFRTTTARLGGVLAALVLLTAFLPAASSGWMRIDPDERSAVREGDWITRHPHRADDASWSDFIGQRIASAWDLESTPAGKTWAIGLGSPGVAALRDHGFDRIDVATFDPMILSDEVSRTQATAASTPALRRLRWTRRRYDTILVGPASPDLHGNADLWTVETFLRLRQTLNSGGRVGVCVPVARLSDAAVSVTARSFGRVFGAGGGWIVGPDPWGGRAVWLVAERQGSAGVGTDAPAGLDRLVRLAGDAQLHTVHSAWAPRLVFRREDTSERLQALVGSTANRTLEPLVTMLSPP